MPAGEGHTQKHNGGGGFLWRLFTRHLTIRVAQPDARRVIELVDSKPFRGCLILIQYREHIMCKMGDTNVLTMNNTLGSGSFGIGLLGKPDQRLTVL